MLQRLTEIDPGGTLDLLKRIYFPEGYADRLSHSALRKFSTRIRTACRTLAARLTPAQRRQWLAWIPNIKLHEARALLDAVCYDHYHEVEDILDRFQQNPQLDEAIKNVAYHHKKVRRQSEGGRPWPELYEDLKKLKTIQRNA